MANFDFLSYSRTALHLEQGGIGAVNINMGNPSKKLDDQEYQEWHVIDANFFTREVKCLNSCLEKVHRLNNLHRSLLL